MSPAVRVLALDFDGVIADSAPESFWIALRSYAELAPGTRFAGRRDLLADGAAPTPEAIAADPLYAAFVLLMPLGNRAEDFGAALAALDREVPLPDQDAYDAFRAGLGEPWLAAYHRRFYEVRSAAAQADPPGWRRLMRPYRPFVELLLRRRGDAALALATAKDRPSVDALLRDYGIEELFPARRVLDKEFGVEKTGHLRELQARERVPFSEITFVDDKVNHLDRVATLGVRCALATWGYNGEREIALARARGHLVCDLADAEALLFA